MMISLTQKKELDLGPIWAKIMLRKMAKKNKEQKYKDYLEACTAYDNLQKDRLLKWWDKNKERIT